jgi:hypothetical protein
MALYQQTLKTAGIPEQDRRAIQQALNAMHNYELPQKLSGE